MKSQDLYQLMVEVINAAADEENIYSVPEAAEAQGMSGGEIKAGLSQRWEYSYSDSSGDAVVVKCHWYDQSKPFSIQPDKHVMTVTFGSQTHTRAYES